MYDHLRGTLVEKQPTRAVLEVAGVGYELTIPLSSFEALPAEGDPAVLHAHLYVREDALRLFGFATADERRFFRTLLDVTGIGPAVALSILSSTRYPDFRSSVVAEDVGMLTRMKGVGKKLAQRMILDLKDRLEKEALEAPRPGRPEVPAVREDAVGALVTLGFTRGAAVKEVDRILARTEGELELSEIVREALRRAR
jgi:Holliday junction DNA helicase RuvA